MKITYTVQNNINIPQEIRKIDNDKFWTFAATEWRDLIERFVPYSQLQKTHLREQTRIRPKEIEYYADYAIKVYNYCDNIHFTTPGTSGEWDKAAIPTERDKFIRTLQNYIDKNIKWR